MYGSDQVTKPRPRLFGMEILATIGTSLQLFLILSSFKYRICKMSCFYGKGWLAAS